MSAGNLTPAQQRIYDDLIALADGRDHRTVLREYDADPADLAAVADVLGGKGAGAALRTILRVQAEN